VPSPFARGTEGELGLLLLTREAFWLPWIAFPHARGAPAALDRFFSRARRFLAQKARKDVTQSQCLHLLRVTQKASCSIFG